MKQLLLFLVLSTSVSSLAQNDYNEIKENFIRYCGRADSITIEMNVAFVDSVATIRLDRGLKAFYMDYAQAYSAKYLESGDRNDLIVAINVLTRCWERFSNTQALYGLVSNYAGVDCFMTKKYLNILKQKIKDKELDFDNYEVYDQQINMIQEFVCPE